MRMREQYCEQSWRFIGEVKLQRILLVKVQSLINFLVPAPEGAQSEEEFEHQKRFKA